jgi:hypothetical protein
VGRGGLEKVGPRRGTERDETITAAFCAHEVRELARRWDEEAERDRPLAKRWVALRLALARCPDDAYEAARSAGAEILESVPIGLKCAIVASFPHEHEWVARVARALVAMPNPPMCARHALVGIADPALALELARLLVRTRRAWEVVLAAHEMVASMGDAAADVLIPIASELGDPKTRAHGAPAARAALLHAIATIKTERVAAWMAEQLGDNVGRRAATAFFRDAPELAPALEGAAKKRSARGRAAKALVAMTADEIAPASRYAPADEVPEILRAPPWRSGAAKKAGGVIEDLPLRALADEAAPKIGEWSAYSGNAWAVAYAWFERPEARDDARKWMTAYPVLAALGLIPMAVGNDGRRRTASRILRMLRDEGHEPAILEAARHYGDDVVRAVTFVLVPDARLDVPIKPPSILKALRLDALPPPRLQSGAALTGDALRNLAELLAVASDLVPYVGCEEVARACEPRSLEAFSWALFEAWTATGASTKSAWPLLALGIFGNDAVARELGPRLRGWAQQHKNVRALEGVRVLEAIAARGSDVAIMQLVNTSQGGVRSDDVKKRAEQALDAVSGARGLDRDQLADRAAPTLGLDERGETILDFGARKFTAVLAGSDVVVRDESGGSHGTLPRVSKDDDAKLAAAAQETWRALKLDAQEAFRAQTRRFEHALRTQRRWPRADVHDVLVRKRILLDLARRLVFSALEGTTPLFRFRITEDGTFADASDRPIDLARASHVVLAHPLDLDDEERARWGQHLADYELLQPFPQMGRETFVLDERAKSSPTTSSFGHTEVDPARLFALEMRGWTHFNDAFTISASGDLYVSFVVGPGFQTRPIPKQSVSELRVMSRTRGITPKLGDIDRITLSEILRDVATLA